MARRKSPGDPLDHCAFNVAIYGPGGNRWAMTERTRHDLRRGPTRLDIGPSAMSWDGNHLTMTIDERCVPYPSRLKGIVRIMAPALRGSPTKLDGIGQHTWFCVAPSTRIEMEFEYPKLRWKGTGYLDCNFGSEPLERAFKTWNWARAHAGDDTLVFYNVERRDGSRLSLARSYDRDGRAREFLPLPETPLSPTLWRVPRSIGCDPGRRPRVVRTLEDAPFYARSMIETTLYGKRVTAIHESLSLDRFASPIVQAMLPFRMPRRRYRKRVSTERLLTVHDARLLLKAKRGGR